MPRAKRTSNDHAATSIKPLDEETIKSYKAEIEELGFEKLMSDEEWEQERLSLAEFGLGANLAHNMAYQGNEDLDSFTIKEEDGQLREYHTVKLDTDHPALQAEIYLPVNDNDQSTVYVNFTGTCDLDTLLADLEYNAGETAFHAHKQKIMAQIGEAIAHVAERTGKPVKLHFSGHSLGGALAQQSLNETLRYMATNLANNLQNKLTQMVANGVQDEVKASDNTKTQIKIKEAELTLTKEISRHNRDADNKIAEGALENFQHLGSVKLSTWSSTGVSHEVANYSNEMADLLVENGANIKARFGMIGGDGVQQTGQNTVLSDCKADVEVLKLDLGLEGFQTNLLKSFLTGTLMTAACVAAGLALGPAGLIVGGSVGVIGRQTVIPAINTIKAHTSPAKCFTDEQALNQTREDGIGYEKINNRTPEGHLKVKKRLQKKSYILQSAPILATKNVLHFAGTTGQSAVNTLSQAASKVGQACSYVKNKLKFWKK